MTDKQEQIMKIMADVLMDLAAHAVDASDRSCAMAKLAAKDRELAAMTEREAKVACLLQCAIADGGLVRRLTVKELEAVVRSAIALVPLIAARKDV